MSGGDKTRFPPRCGRGAVIVRGQMGSFRFSSCCLAAPRREALAKAHRLAAPRREVLARANAPHGAQKWRGPQSVTAPEEHRGVDPLRRVRYSQLQPTFAGGGSARLVTKLRGDYELVAFSPVRPVPSIQDRPVGCGRAFAGRFVGSGYRRLQQQFSAGIAAGQSPPTATTTSAADRNGDGGSAADVADRRIADPHLGGAASERAISRAAVLRKPGGLGRQRRAALSCRIGGDFAQHVRV